jgi:hypothetical protein
MPLNRIIIAATALVLAAETTRADGLKPIQAQHLELGRVSGNAYYTVEPDGFHVVATLVQDGKDETPIRVQTVLASGQSVMLSTPGGGLGVEPVTITLERRDDKLAVRAGSRSLSPGL